MGIGTLLAVAGGGFFLSATPRVDGPLHGWRGTMAGLAAVLLAVWLVHVGGLGWATSIAWVSGVVFLAVPCLSYRRAVRRRRARGAR